MGEQKRGTPIKRRYLSAIGLSSVKMVADKHRHATEVFFSTYWRFTSQIIIIIIIIIITSTGDKLNS